MANVKVYSEASVACRNDTAIAAGLGNHLPIGSYSGADYRSAIRFPTPPGWTGWTSITKATITVYISDHQHVGPVNSDIYCSRMNVTSPIWTKSAGSQSCENGFTGANNTQAGDIQSVSTDRVAFTSGSTANAAKTIDVTGAMRYYWGSGSQPSLKPVFVFDNVGAGDYTELWANGKSGYDAYLSIDYESNTVPNAPTLNSPGNGATVLSDRPTLNFTPNDAQGNAHAAYNYQVALDAGFTSIYEDQTVTGPFTNGVPIDRQVINTLPTRGATYYWRVRTSDASLGFGAWATAYAVVLQANPVVNIDATRYMDFSGGAPRLRVKWSVSGGTQSSYRVTTASGYDSGPISGGTQDHLLATLGITDNVAQSITVTVATTDSLNGAATRSFTPRYGLTTHRRDLGAVPVNWGNVTSIPTPAAGTQLILEYGSNTSAAAAPTAWYTTLGGVPKAQWLYWRAWFIPSATTGPTLDTISIVSDRTTGKSADQWLRWPNTAFGTPWAIDESEYVYGTRSVRVDRTGSWEYLKSAPITVKAGRSYILTGLMKSQGNTGAFFALVASDGNDLWSTPSPEQPVSKMIRSDPLTGTVGWFNANNRDVNRYKTPVWKATFDGTVYALLEMPDAAAAGSQAWFDALKVEESTVATPWSPASIGSTVIDAGGVQIDGSKGGLLRYKGSFGGVRDLIEGGGQGLRIGGDMEVWSPKTRMLQLSDGVDLWGQAAISQGASGSTQGYWWRAGYGAIYAQYWGHNIIGTAMMHGAASAGYAAAATVNISVYQNDVMGTQPLVGVMVDPTWPFVPSDFKVVITSTTGGGTTYELWIRSTTPWFMPEFKIQHMTGQGSGYWQNGNGELLQAASSAGTAHIGRPWDANSGDGTAFPVPVRSKQRFYNHNWDNECYWDGSRWLTTPAVEINNSFQALSATSTLQMIALRSGDNIPMWIRDLSWNYNVAGTHNGANYWRLDVNLYDGGGYGTPLSISTNGVTTNAWFNPGSSYIGYLAGTNWKHLYIYISKIGTPGNLYLDYQLRYQWVAQ